MSLESDAVALDRRRSLATGAGLAALGGAALVLASPPFGVWPLVFVGFVPIVLAQNRVLPKAQSGAALAVGFGGYLVVTLWETFEPEQRWWFVGLVLGLYVGGWVSRASWELTGRRHLWSDPVIWTATLFCIGLTPIASWVDPAYDLYRQPWLDQPVSLVGLAGLNLLVMLVNYAIAGFVVARSSVSIPTTAVVAALLAGWAGTSLFMFDTIDHGSPVRVAAVQPGLTDLTSPAGEAARSRAVDATLRRLESSTRVATARGADLVVWPETVLRYVDPERDLGVRLSQLVRGVGIDLVFGYTEDPARYNRAALVTRDGQFAVAYDKQHPVTFQGDHSIGGPVRVARTDVGVVAPIICYDLDYPGTARSAVRHGAQVLAVPSWDWSGIAEQHYAHLVFRSIENRVPAVKADTAWDSVIVDSDGRIRQRFVSPRGDDAVLVATVHVGTGTTFYTRSGDWLAWSTVAMSVLWAIWIVGAFARLRKAIG